MKNVVVIGGGTGQSALLGGLKQVSGISLKTIVTVADDGGSTGRLRCDMHLPAMGDIRSVMLALAESENIMGTLMNYRFDENAGELAGHNLGNIMLSALTKKAGSFTDAIADLSKVLKVKGTVIPSTLNYVTLCAHVDDGEVIVGEHNITEAHRVVRDVFYNSEVQAYPAALKAIKEADIVIIGIGSVYTSILPNLIIDEIREALCNTKASIVYYCNCMTQYGETHGYSVEKHVEVIEKHLGKKVIDAVVYSNDSIPEDIMKRYEAEHADQVRLAETEHPYKLYSHSLLSFDTGKIRHDAAKVRDSFIRVMEDL